MRVNGDRLGGGGRFLAQTGICTALHGMLFDQTPS